jgi:parvulin-like peptidyl-prolyl isomerase
MRYAMIVLLCLGLAACGKHESAKKLDKLVDVEMGAQGDDGFKAWLELKHITLNNRAAVDRLRQQYERENAVADGILKEGKLDMRRVEAELRNYRNQLVLAQYMDKYLAEAVTDEMVKKEYEKNKEDYKSASYELSRIALHVQGGEAAANKTFRQAVKIYSGLKGRASFERAARKYSFFKAEGKKGGAMGWVDGRRLEPVVAQVLQSLKNGQVSKPIRTVVGYEIYRLDAEPKISYAPFEQVKARIRYDLRTRARQEELKRLAGSAS